MILAISFLLVAVPLAYYYLTRKHDHWKKMGVPFIPPSPLIGNLKNLLTLKQSPGEFCGNLYNAPEGKNQKFFGIFLWNSEPALFLRDPELIKQMYVKDFEHFTNRNMKCNRDHDPIGHDNLFVLRDEKWKYLRSKLSPTFTSGKIKQMFKLTMGVTDELVVNINKRIERNESVIGMSELAARFTTDVIATCAFGIQSNSLNDANATFREFGRKIFLTPFRRAFELRAFFFMHGLAKIIRATLVNKDSQTFFKRVFWEAMDAREKQGIVRNDFLDTLLNLKRDAAKKREKYPENKEIFEFDGDFLVAQSVLFFMAGFETSSTTIGNTLAELSCNPDVQEKLRQEVLESFESHGGELSYEGLFEMKYLDQVISETLRKYPPMPFLDRVCTKDYKIPDTDVVIEKGTPVFASLYGGLHYDSKYFPDPERYDPDRFNDQNKATRHPFSYLPFGEGPHICIGMRFGLMNVKSAVATIISKYRVEPDGIEMPMKINPAATFLKIDNPINLKFSTL